MALLFQRNEIGLERTGFSVTVPDNDVARLMYYLQCVCNTISCNDDPDIQRFTNYKNWASLSFEEQKALLVVCYTVSPDIFMNRVFFQNDELCGNRSNEFYTINQVRSQILAAESIVIAGQVRRVNKIMTFQMSWMKTYYFDPMERLVSRHSTPRAVTHRSNYTWSVERQPTRNSSCSKRKCGCICCGVVCVLFILPFLIAFIIGIINTNTKK